MQGRTGSVLMALLGLALAAGVAARGQTPPQRPPQKPAQQPAQPAQPAPPAGAPTEGHGDAPPPGAQPPPRPAGQQGPPSQARFPAHQRPPADPAVVERGRGLYVSACGACHGADARGGQLGGPNLLRSQLVLNDHDGELIYPVVRDGRPNTLMVPMPVPEADVKAIAAYLHHLQAQGSNQGGPPPGTEVALNILVGNAATGATFFAASCSRCHSATGDLKGIGARVPDAKTLQNLWVSGGRAQGRGIRPTSSGGTAVKAAVTLPSGEKIEGQLVRLDDFLVTVALEDGTTRTIRRRGDEPKVEIDDPFEGHRELLATLTNRNMHDVTAYLATLK